MTPKSKLAILALFAGAMSMASDRPHNDGSIGHGIPDKPKKIIPKGAKEFTYRGVTVIAISEKRAINKIDKILKQNTLKS